MKIPTFLKKGKEFSLTQAAGSAGLSCIKIGLGWDARGTPDKPFQLDASVSSIRKSTVCKLNGGRDSFANTEAIALLGEDKYGIGVRNKEVIEVALDKLLLEGTQKTVIAVTIYRAEERHQRFGYVTTTYAEIVNAADSNILAIYEIPEHASPAQAMLFVEVYNEGGEWMIKGVGHGYDGSDEALLTYYGYPVDGGKRNS